MKMKLHMYVTESILFHNADAGMAHRSKDHSRDHISQSNYTNLHNNVHCTVCIMYSYVCIMYVCII